ncbi:hypothetical protein BD779DRAFT_1156124 [Infundibulicybe gibba]|nr:hypothetical protein BD779DRAFT_1156124 [Infundibulicybe gibba]
MHDAAVDVGAEAVVQRVLHLLFEDPSYPRAEKKGAGKRKSTGGGGSPAKKAKMDYTSTERESGGGPGYGELAIEQLQVDFPLVPKPYLRNTFKAQRNLYAPTHIFISNLDKTNLPYVPKMTPYRPNAKGKTRLLQDEAFEKEREWLKGEYLPAAIAEDPGEEADDGIECGCCFSTYPFDKMIQCPEAHLFCTTCMTSYASNLLGEHNPNIKCMAQSGCTLPFPDSELKRFLTPKLMELYERVKQRKEIEAAGLEGLEECPFCEWKCVFEVGKEEDKLFRCGNEEGGCGVVSCRGCKKLDHVPKSCTEAEEDKHLDGRHAIEEAMTRALMRNCPKCQKAFIKEQGCNKMTCPSCRTLSCYICRQIIKGYDHFNQNPHAPTSSRGANKCLLWDPVEQRHADEVKAAAEKATAEYRRQNPDVADAEIRVDLPVAPAPAPAPAQNPQHFLHPHAMPIYQAYHQPEYPLPFGDRLEADIRARLQVHFGQRDNAQRPPGVDMRQREQQQQRAWQEARQREHLRALERVAQRHQEEERVHALRVQERARQRAAQDRAEERAEALRVQDRIAHREDRAIRRAQERLAEEGARPRARAAARVGRRR